MRKRVKLTESQLNRVIRESVNQILVHGEDKVKDVFNAFISDKKYVQDLINQYIQDPEIFDDPDLSDFYAFAEEIAEEHDMTEDEAVKVVNMLEDYIKHRAQDILDKRRNELAESQMLDENIDAHLGIDDICNMLGGGDEGYDTLNKILWSLQEQGVIDFDEDALDRLYNSPNY